MAHRSGAAAAAANRGISIGIPYDGMHCAVLTYVRPYRKRRWRGGNIKQHQYQASGVAAARNGKAASWRKQRRRQRHRRGGSIIESVSMIISAAYGGMWQQQRNGGSVSRARQRNKHNNSHQNMA